MRVSFVGCFINASKSPMRVTVAFLIDNEDTMLPTSEGKDFLESDPGSLDVKAT
jgi:hypothetical protein